MSNGVESHDGESEATNGHDEDVQTETGEGVSAPAVGGEEEEEEEEEGSEVVPVGTVNDHGEVVDSSGQVLGKVEGDVPEGSIVDTEGYVSAEHTTLSQLLTPLFSQRRNGCRRQRYRKS